MADLLVRRARLLGKDGLFDIVVEKGEISKVAKSEIQERGKEVIDAEGNLVLPSFVEPHVHLDKVLLAEETREASSISEAREIVKEAKKKFTVSGVSKRIEKVIPLAIENGVTKIRSHVDVDEYAKLVSVEALLSLKKKYSGIVDFQIVAFPQEGLLKDSESLELLRKALDMGADVVGGLPEAELSQDDSKRHVDHAIAIAIEAGRDIDMHCDVLPFGKVTEYFASEVIRKGIEAGRATADHLIALSYYDDYYASKVIGLLKMAGINVISNPCTMMTSGNLDRPPRGRGVTRIKELLKAGVNLAFGLDNLVDPYNPFGDFNALLNGWFFAYAGQLNSSSEIESLLEMPTLSSARILRLKGYGIEPGSKADFNVMNSKDPRSALRFHQKPRYVIENGNILVENRYEITNHYELPS